MTSKSGASNPLLLALLGLARHSAASSSVYNHGTRVPGAMVHFEFARDECKEGAFSDAAADALFGTLVRSSTTTCNNGLGVALSGYTTAGAAQVVSSDDATAFAARMSGRSGFSLELWISTEDDSSSATDRPLFTMGAVGDSTGDTCATTHGHGTYGLSLYDRESNNNVRHLLSSHHTLLR
jgi:hypothetical protein